MNHWNNERPDNWVGFALKKTRNLLNLLTHGQICQDPSIYAGREFHKIRIYSSTAQMEFIYDQNDDMSTQLTIIHALQKDFVVEGVKNGVKCN
jgi:hypothetical protein